MIGSPYEGFPIKHKNFEAHVSFFTDDTVLTVAVADAILGDGDFADALKRFAQLYPTAGYGGSFRRWIWTWENEPYCSFDLGDAIWGTGFDYLVDSEKVIL